MKYLISGGKKLEGEIKISGNKNSLFPCVSAALLTNEEVVLENIPDIVDTKVLVEILEKLGVSVERFGDTLKIKAEKLGSELPIDLTSRLRGSVVLAGSILARTGKVHFRHPGGDVIGKRGIEAHLEGFAAMGASFVQDDLEYFLKFNRSKNKDMNKDIFLSERSVTGTENLILFAVCYPGRVRFRNCASEPHVVDLCNMLVSMGANIEGIGTDSLTIKGKDKLKGTRFRIREDYIEIGTYAVAAAITGGKITLNNIDDTDIDPILFQLEKFGILYQRNTGNIIFSASKLEAINKLTTNVWPGFPTDLMSVSLILATQAKGVTLCHDWMFESRMFFTDKLILMGAIVTIADPHRVLVYGPSRLKGRELETPDIRAGMALVLAGLIAKGQTIVNKAELIERGYEDVVGKLRSLGADIERVE